LSFKVNCLGQVRFGNEIEDILKLKGIDYVDEFLNPNDSCVEDYNDYDNIIKARNCLVKHIAENHTITLLVDCDCDGYTSAALMYQYIRRINNDVYVRVVINDNKQHGLKSVVGEIAADTSKLVIIPDASTGDITECRNLIEDCGKDVIILDHHKIEDGFNNPAIVVNNQLSKAVSNKALTGVGVCYKFAKALDDYYNVRYADDYLDLVATGMIADGASMLQLETRHLVQRGMKQLADKTNKNEFLSLVVEKKKYSMKNKVSFNGIGFYVTPLINALIRFGTCEQREFLFKALCNHRPIVLRQIRGEGKRPIVLSEYVYKDCEQAHRKQKTQTEESVLKLSEDIKIHNLNELPILICNAKDDVDKNSTGLVANKLINLYQKPCLLLRRFSNVCAGSARGYKKSGISNFNEWCKQTGLFTKVQGHSNAFGVSIPFENTNKLIELVSTLPKTTEPTYCVYGMYDGSKLSTEIIKRIAQYEYVWGCEVEEPLFFTSNVVVNKFLVSLLGAKQNKIEIKYHNITIVKFATSGTLVDEYTQILNCGDNIKFDIVGKFKQFNNSAQIQVEDWSFEKSNVRANVFGC
jgi:single-stranded-DNA-specific exonuclease